MLLKSVICLCIWVCGLHSPWSSQNFSIPSVHSSVNVLGVLLLVAGRGQSDCLWLVEKIMEMGYKWYLDYSWVHKSSMIGFFMLFYDETHFLSPHPHLLLLLLSLSLIFCFLGGGMECLWFFLHQVNTRILWQFQTAQIRYWAFTFYSLVLLKSNIQAEISCAIYASELWWFINKTSKNDSKRM